MLARVMGAAVFSVGFVMLLLGLGDLLRPEVFGFGFGERVLIYLGGIILCLLGYFMARRLPRVTQPEEIVQTSVTEHREGPPPENF